MFFFNYQRSNQIISHKPRSFANFYKIFLSEMTQSLITCGFKICFLFFYWIIVYFLFNRNELKKSIFVFNLTFIALGHCPLEFTKNNVSDGHKVTSVLPNFLLNMQSRQNFWPPLNLRQQSIDTFLGVIKCLLKPKILFMWFDTM